MRRQVVETVLETDAVLLRYYVAEKIVHHELRRFVHGAELRQVLLKGLELFKERGAYKWLSDDRGNGPLKPADEQWARTEWFPRVKAAGWKYWAVVLPEKVLGQMNMKRWIELYAAEGIEAQAFLDPDEALTWIRER